MQFEKKKKKGIEKKAQTKNTPNNLVLLMLDEIKSDTKVLLYKKKQSGSNSTGKHSSCVPRRCPGLYTPYAYCLLTDPV